jgi:HNH endonuclease
MDDDREAIAYTNVTEDDWVTADPIRPTSAPPIDRDAPCIDWDGELDRDGYGRSGSGRSHSQVAHVYVWEEAVADIPEGCSLDHVCRNRACINLAHLDLVTWSENSLRRWQKPS